MLCESIVDPEVNPTFMSMEPNGRQGCQSEDCLGTPMLKVRVRYGEGNAASCARHTVWVPTEEDPEVSVAHHYIKQEVNYTIKWWKSNVPPIEDTLLHSCDVQEISTRDPEDAWARIVEECGEEVETSTIDDCTDPPPGVDYVTYEDEETTYTLEVDEEGGGCGEALARVAWGEWSAWVNRRLGTHRSTLGPFGLAESLRMNGYALLMEVELLAVLKPLVVVLHRFGRELYGDAPFTGDPTVVERILLQPGISQVVRPAVVGCSNEGVTYEFLRLLCFGEAQWTRQEE